MVYKTFLTHTGVYYGGMRDGAAYGLLIEVNELAAQGVHAGSAEIRIEIPADMDKSRMHSIRNHIAKAMEKLETEDFQLEELYIAGEKCAALRVPQIVITAAGETDQKERIADALLTARAGQDIVYAGWAGLGGMRRIIGEKEEELTLHLRATKDIAASLGAVKRKDQLLVGFALETNNEQQNAEGKLERKNFDFIVLNSLNDAGAGFRHDTNKISIIDRKGRTDYPLKSKTEVARDIIDRLSDELKHLTLNS